MSHPSWHVMFLRSLPRKVHFHIIMMLLFDILIMKVSGITHNTNITSVVVLCVCMESFVQVASIRILMLE